MNAICGLPTTAGNRVTRAMLAVVAVACFASETFGQQVPPPDEPGMWIRFSTRPAESAPVWRVARVIDITDAFLVVEPIGQGALAVDRGIVTRVERSEGWRDRRALGGAVGAVLGAAAGVGLLLATDCQNCVAMAGMGFGVGWWAGQRQRRFHWMIIPLDRVDVMLRPRRIAGVGIQIGIGPF